MLSSSRRKTEPFGSSTQSFFSFAIKQEVKAMVVKCGDGVSVNLSHPVFKSVVVSQKSKVILAIGEGFYMKFSFYAKQRDTYYGELVEVVSVSETKEVMQ